MTSREFMKAPGMRYALGLLALAVLTTGWVTVKAFRVDAIKAPTTSALAKVGLISPQPASAIDIGAVIGTDPFEANRIAPKLPYRLPGDTDVTAAAAAAAKAGAREPPKPTVVGTAVNPDSTKSFATCQIGGGQAKQVHIGQKIGEFTLVSIQLRKVVFLNAAGQPVEVNANR